MLAAGGAAVIYAADSGSGQGGPGGGVAPGWGGRPWWTRRVASGDPAAAVSDALHGEFVVPDGHGGYNTELTQTGKLTDISDTSVTATQRGRLLADLRHHHRYPPGPAAVAPRDTATIRAVENNGTNTATVISPAR